jgi:hypothetical protein
MRKTSQQLIDGKKYEVGHWSLDKQLEIMVKLIKLFGEPVAMMIMGALQSKGSLKEALNAELSLKMSSEAIRALMSRLSEGEVKSLLREVTEGILCDGKQVSYDVHFMGQIMHLLKVALFCIRHQYQDFLDVLPDLAKSSLGATNMSQESST